MAAKSIFLAESETHVRNALRLILNFQEDFEIAGEASSVESLLDAVLQNPPDIILLDWNLTPNKHQDLIRLLRKYCAETRLIATSVKPEHKLAAWEAGMDVFISQQLPPDEFLALLRTFLKQEKKILKKKG